MYVCMYVCILDIGAPVYRLGGDLANEWSESEQGGDNARFHFKEKEIAPTLQRIDVYVYGCMWMWMYVYMYGHMCSA